ncbi:hypothetical protein [Flavonifractor sp. An306]|uniref:hypothetical protein n=1 Tax=Flavonifractor sp. An306 TaxID=1965629 RepID=UPI00174EC0ED|nr:hypothetical protein [Flavonifractor sp. An306]
MGAVDVSDHWSFNSIIVGFGSSFNAALLEQVHNSHQVLDISYTYPQHKWHPAAGLYANVWLMRELARNRPMLYRKEEMARLELLADKLCEECFLLSAQQ